MKLLNRFTYYWYASVLLFCLTHSMEQDAPSPLILAMSNLKILSTVLSHIRGDFYRVTLTTFHAFNRVNKEFNVLLSTPSILHQIVYQVAEQSCYYDEIDIAKSMKKMRGFSHPAFARWFTVRQSQRKLEEKLFKAAQNNEYDTLKTLIEKERVHINARNAYGKTALSIAASFGATDAVAQLLKNGADVNLPNKCGWTPLKKASNEGTLPHQNRMESVKLLLQAGACTDQEDDAGYTPLMIACPEIAEILITHKANVSHQAFEDGTTPLMWAVIKNKIQTVSMLLDAGAHDNARRKSDGLNAREIAKIYGESRANILELLEKKFGK